jgi:anti-sigma-K factor RskA
MATEHEYWLERGDIYALDALDGDELKEFQAHLGSNCAICVAYLRETRETLNLLHRALRPVTPRPEVKARVLDEIRNERVVSIATPQPKQATRWLRITGTIAAGIIGFVVAGTYYQYRYEQRRLDSAVITLLRDPSTRDLPLYGAGLSPKARGRFLWNNSGEGHIFVANLPSVPEGKTYAVWTIARNSAPRYVGAIAIDANGEGTTHIKSTPSGSPPETFAVSLEDKGTTATPAGPIVLISKQS